MRDEVIRMNENSWRIEDNGVRFFLLTGTERALLMEPYLDVKRISRTFLIAGSKFNDK